MRSAMTTPYKSPSLCTKVTSASSTAAADLCFHSPGPSQRANFPRLPVYCETAFSSFLNSLLSALPPGCPFFEVQGVDPSAIVTEDHLLAVLRLRLLICNRQ